MNKADELLQLRQDVIQLEKEREKFLEDLEHERLRLAEEKRQAEEAEKARVEALEATRALHFEIYNNRFTEFEKGKQTRCGSYRMTRYSTIE